MSQSGASTTVSSTKKIGEGSLVLTVTYWPQIEQVVQKQDLLCGQEKSDTPPWFTDDDFKEILKKISGVSNSNNITCVMYNLAIYI